MQQRATGRYVHAGMEDGKWSRGTALQPRVSGGPPGMGSGGRAQAVQGIEADRWARGVPIPGPPPGMGGQFGGPRGMAGPTRGSVLHKTDNAYKVCVFCHAGTTGCLIAGPAARAEC